MLLKLNLVKHYFPLIAFLFLLSSCARSISFNSSTAVPAAVGEVHIKKDKNKNYALDIEMKNLAKPESLTPPKPVYVVWMETSSNDIKNIGQLKSTSGLFGQALKASLKAVTSFEPHRIFITAEDDPAIQYPGSQEIISTNRID
ncbi:MAG: hypothetical protein J7497_08765 [Chitinophagaceae bacterium]|nr:hypothetical protein [Chitinophagaceae bacterium]